MQSSSSGIGFFYLCCSHKLDSNLLPEGSLAGEKNPKPAEALTHPVEELSRSLAFQFLPRNTCSVLITVTDTWNKINLLIYHRFV